MLTIEIFLIGLEILFYIVGILFLLGLLRMALAILRGEENPFTLGRKPDYEEEITKVGEKPKYKQFEKDEIYEQAVKLVLQTRQASVSMLQRRLGVGYTRAARLIDMMEDERIVGPYQGSKPRDILVEAEGAESIDEES